MSTIKTSPAPWVTDGGGHVQALYTPTDGGKPFYHTIARTDQPLVTPEQASANSLLIAAAPKLLQACIASDTAINQKQLDDAVVLIKEAIADATGEEK